MGVYKYNTDIIKEIAKTKSPNIEIIGNFTKINEDILCNCLKDKNHKNFYLKTEYIIYRGYGCPYCVGKRVCYEDSLEYNYPEISKQWNDCKNDGLKPSDVSYGSNKKINWTCELGHEWVAKISDRIFDNSGCPICSNKKILIGYNDLWTTEPKSARLLLYPSDGYKCTRRSDKRFDWKCPDCGNIIKDKCVSNIIGYKLCCPKCSDGFSYPNKFIFNILNQLSLDFETEKTFDWCKYKLNNKYHIGRYDFVIDNIIIEADGSFHTKPHSKDIRTLSEIQFIDLEKDRLAEENGYKIIRIDCSISRLEYIKDNILQSELNNMFDFRNIDWDNCDINASKSRYVEIINLWKNGNKDVNKLSEQFKISKQTVNKYLKKLLLGGDDF